MKLKKIAKKKGSNKMKLEARNLLEEKLKSLKQTMFDLFTDEYNSKVCTRNVVRKR